MAVVVTMTGAVVRTPRNHNLDGLSTGKIAFFDNPGGERVRSVDTRRTAVPQPGRIPPGRRGHRRGTGAFTGGLPKKDLLAIRWAKGIETSITAVSDDPKIVDPACG